AGVNAYIAACKAAGNCPGEYSLTSNGAPVPFKLTDYVAIGGVIGGLFGGGGGNEMQSALVRLAARAKYGPTEGDAVWTAFRQQNDPEAVLTLHDGQSFPYGAAAADAASVVLPDQGTAVVEPVVTGKSGSATAGTGGATQL